MNMMPKLMPLWRAPNLIGCEARENSHDEPNETPIIDKAAMNSQICLGYRLDEEGQLLKSFIRFVAGARPGAFAGDSD